MLLRIQHLYPDVFNVVLQLTHLQTNLQIVRICSKFISIFNNTGNVLHPVYLSATKSGWRDEEIASRKRLRANS